MPRILHLITGLGIGGAEMMLFKLLSTSDRERYTHRVLVLDEAGPMAERIRGLGISVESLAMRGGPVAWMNGFLRLRRLLTTDPPDVLQSWMYHADFIAAVALVSAKVSVPLLWGIRQSNLSSSSPLPIRILARACALISGSVPIRIVCCAESARRTHVEWGYATDKIVVIPNGFDTTLFIPDDRARCEVRRELGIGEEVPLAGIVGRYDPQKDHQTFIRALDFLSERRPHVHVLACGMNVDSNNTALCGAIAKAGISDRVHLLGARRDMARLITSLDVLVSSSAYGEGFPNVVGEAMACAVPCVVTDTGDSAAIVANTGKVVAAGDAEALATAVADILDLPAEERRALGRLGRARIQAHFSLPVIVSRYESLYEKVLLPCAD